MQLNIFTWLKISRFAFEGSHIVSHRHCCSAVLLTHSQWLGIDEDGTRSDPAAAAGTRVGWWAQLHLDAAAESQITAIFCLGTFLINILRGHPTDKTTHRSTIHCLYSACTIWQPWRWSVRFCTILFSILSLGLRIPLFLAATSALDVWTDCPIHLKSCQLPSVHFPSFEPLWRRPAADTVTVRRIGGIAPLPLSLLLQNGRPTDRVSSNSNLLHGDALVSRGCSACTKHGYANEERGVVWIKAVAATAEE